MQNDRNGSHKSTGSLFSWTELWLWGIVFWIMIVSRSPEAVFHPQFWAEDGCIFYAQAYNQGAFRAILIPYAGYLHLTPRLTAAIAQLFPLTWAPFIFALIALVIQALPAFFLLSNRLAYAMPNFFIRLLLAILYLALPNSWEININITNAQWHLALLAILIVLAEPANTKGWYIFDVLLLVLAGLSGPFSVFLFPVAFLRWWQLRNRQSLIIATVTGATATIQGLVILYFGRAARIHNPLEASLISFSKIFAGQVILGSAIGQKGYAHIWASSLWVNPVLPLLVTSVSLVLFAFAIIKAPQPLKLFVLYAVLVFVASLISPEAGNISSNWEAMIEPGNGGRYYFLPMLAWLVILVWGLWGFRQLLFKTICGLFLASTLLIGIPIDWAHPKLPDLYFAEQAKTFEQAPPGTTMTIPINPQGWSMTLVKKSKKETFSGVNSSNEKLTFIGHTAFFSVDSINGRWPYQEGKLIIIHGEREKTITITGWAVDERTHQVAGGVLMNVDGKLDIVARYGLDRIDVATYFKNPQYRFSGYSVFLATSLLGKGRHTILFKVVTADKKGYYVADPKIVLEIK